MHSNFILVVLFLCINLSAFAILLYSWNAHFVDDNV